MQTLRLTGVVLAEIYLGQVTNWDDPAIARLNRGLELPNLKITPVWRSDPCSETYTFTSFLSATSAVWRSQKASAPAVSLGIGVPEGSDAALAAEVARTPGAIGYLSTYSLLARQLPTAAIQNRSGSYELPQLGSIADAAAAVRSFPATGVSIVDPPGSEKSAYPVASFTYAIIPASVTHPALLESFCPWQ